MFATTAGVGHFGPLVPFARATHGAGHEVLVVGQAGAARAVQRAGLPFKALAEPRPEALARFKATQNGLPELEAMARALSELYVRLYAKTALPGMLAALEEWKPDVVVRETAEFSSLVAAERFGIPHAVVGIGLSTQLEDKLLPMAAPALDELAATVGVPADIAARATGSAGLTMAPPSLDDPGARRRGRLHRFRDVRGTGGSLPVAWGDPDTPVVYVSFGTEVPSPTRDYFPDVYLAALDALADLPLRVLVTIGDRRDPGELGAQPPSVRIERWVSQADVMPYADAMVGHGGAGSTLTALAAGVPMALVPLFADQPRNARRVAELGAGIALDSDPGSLRKLGPAVHRLLTDPRYGDRARDVADEIRTLPPVDDAVELLSSLATDDELAA